MSYQIIQHDRVTWTNIIQPTPSDVERLGKAYTMFHPLDLEDCLSRIERPKIEGYENYMFIVMHFPRWDKRRRISTPSEVDFFVGSGFVVTIHEGALKPLVNLFDLCQESDEARKQHLGRGASRLLHTISDRLVDYLFPILYKVDANIRTIEENLFEEDGQRIIQDISFVRRDIISLRRIVRPQLPILENLENVDRPFIREDLDVYFGDILDHLQKARDIVDDDAEVISSLADTNDALQSHRINVVMRTLTVISVIMLPLTLIAGVLGMNVMIPFSEDPLTLWVIMGSMLLMSVFMLIYFRYRGWI
ncbi:MAG: magnesium transporter CorA family protein [Chloroflexi bacterium]|nr:magnesium transporter CorA family protein [Chloroflexota bacterium]